MTDPRRRRPWDLRNQPYGAVADLQAAALKSPAALARRGPSGQHPPAAGNVSYFWIAYGSLVAAWLPVMEANKTAGIWRLPLYRIGDILLLALVVSAISGRLARPVGLPIWLAGAVLIPAAGFVSGNGGLASESVVVAIKFGILCVLAPAVFRYQVEKNRRFMPWVIGSFVASQTISAAAGIAQQGGARVLGQAEMFGRSTGLSGHPNTLAIMCVIAMLTILAVVFNVSPHVKFMLWCAFAINLVALVTTGSLSAILAGGVGLVVLLATMRRVLAALVIAVATGLASVLIDFSDAWFVSFLELRFAKVTGTTGEGASSWEARMLTYQWALDYIARDPIYGVGMDGANSGTFNGTTSVHNLLLHSWYQGGILLFIWFAGVTTVVLLCIARSVIRGENYGSAGVAATVITFAMVSAFFVQQQHWLPLLFVLATFPPGPVLELSRQISSSRAAETGERSAKIPAAQSL